MLLQISCYVNSRELFIFILNVFREQIAINTFSKYHFDILLIQPLYFYYICKQRKGETYLSPWFEVQ